MKHILFPIALCLLALLAGCGQKAAQLPASSEPTQEQAAIWPDYRDIVVPPNIAPLNFMVKSPGKAFAVSIEGKQGRPLIAAAGEDAKLALDSAAWRALLEANKGSDLAVTVYARQEDGRWLRHPAYTITVAKEEIDPYLSYRLIEPGFELYRQLGLYQRNLTNFDVHTIYENNRTFDVDHNHCINCHNYQNYDTERMLFHIRATHGGTVITDGDNVAKYNMKVDSVIGNAVYPSWHPTKNWLVFSSNLTGQVFHMRDKQKIEVLDYGSDLIFYDADAKTVSNILKTGDYLENFPCWTPDGKSVYFCRAYTPGLDTLPELHRSDRLLPVYNKLRYNLMRIDFDEATRTFGQPQLELDCDSMQKSVSVPRVSPDGRYLLFTLGDFGQFHIWHTSSDLYIKDLQTGELRALTNTNSDNVDSYHTWSSNGRWIVFSSRRDDGSFTRPYIAYFDAEGRDHKAFILPQADPEQHILLMKSYNVPELTRNAVRISAEQFKEVIYDDASTVNTSYAPLQQP